MELFATNRSQWLSVINTEVSAPVFFAVTDLDQNGRLEILASFCQGTGHFSTNHLWEADPETQTLAEARMSLPEGDSQADLSFQNTAQCYYDAAAGQYHYIFSDTLKIGAPEYHYSVRALTLYQGDLSDQVLAQKTELYTDDGSAEITCADAQGNPLPEVFCSLSSRTQGAARALFLQGAECCRRLEEVPFSQAWRQSVEGLEGVTPEGRAALAPLGEVLGRYEAGGQREAIQQARAALERARGRAAEERRRMGRVYQ